MDFGVLPMCCIPTRLLKTLRICFQAFLLGRQNFSQPLFAPYFVWIVFKLEFDARCLRDIALFWRPPW